MVKSLSAKLNMFIVHVFQIKNHMEKKGIIPFELPVGF